MVIDFCPETYCHWHGFESGCQPQVFHISTHG